VAFLYVSQSNCIDLLNQARQFELRLEKHWITHDGFFRIVTTLFGVCVVDAWMGYKWHCHPNHRHKTLPLLQFVNMLTLDLFRNPFFKSSPTDKFAAHSIRPNNIPNNIRFKQHSSVISTITMDPAISSDDVIIAPPEVTPVEHRLKRANDMVVNSYTNNVGTSVQSTRTQRSRCKVCTKKTAWFCTRCSRECNKKVWLCHPGITNRDCVDANCVE